MVLFRREARGQELSFRPPQVSGPAGFFQSSSCTVPHNARKEGRARPLHIFSLGPGVVHQGRRRRMKKKKKRSPRSHTHAPREHNVESESDGSYRMDDEDGDGETKESVPPYTDPTICSERNADLLHASLSVPKEMPKLPAVRSTP